MLPSLHEKSSSFIRLFGEITPELYRDFCNQLDKTDEDALVTLLLTTPGGDPDIARQIGLDIQFFQKKTGREVVFLGQTILYSAGTVVMAAFPKKQRFLTDNTMLLIHERNISKEVIFSGPMRHNIDRTQELLAEFKNAQQLEAQDFKALVENTRMPIEEILSRAMSKWYFTAQEAKHWELIEDII